jgi:PAS domain S-box-containing protein
VDTAREYSAEEVTRLHDRVNDLVSIMALPALSTGGEWDQIVSTLLDALLGTLRLGFVCVRLNDPEGGRSIELVRVAESLQGTAGAREISQAIDSSLGDVPPRWPSRAQVFIREVDLSVACAPLGIRGEIGVVAAGCRRSDFPTQTERLVLDVAANQAAIGLQQAHLSEQKRFAVDLDERVALRTNELAAANDRLKKEAEEHRQSEAALHERERESRLIADSIPGLVATLTPTGEVESVNNQVLEYCGRTLEELKEWGTSDTVHPEDLLRAIQVITHSMTLGDPYEIVERIRRFDGVYRWFQVRGLPLRDSNGRIARWYVLLTDIDDLKRAEDALRESERESRLIVDSIPGFVAVFTPGGEVEFVNRPILDYFGRTLEELKRWGTGGTTHPEDLPRVVELFTHSIASGDPFEFEVRARRFDGVYRWFQSRGFPLRDTSGHIVRWYNLLIDIDERKRAEEALAASERNLKLIIDTIPALAWSARPDGSAEFFNQHYLDFTGLSAEQASGWGWTAAVHPEDVNGLAATWQRIMASEAPGESEARLRRHDGEYRWFLVRANPLRDESGNIVKWYGINTDIEDRKRAEDKARLIIDTALDAVVAMDAQGRITSWNTQAEAVFGWSHKEAIGQRMSDMIIPAQHRMAHERGLRHFFDTGEGPILRRRIEVTAVGRSGVEFPVELEVMPVRLGQEWVFSAFIRDITDSRLAHEKLRESERNLRQMTETIPEMLGALYRKGPLITAMVACSITRASQPKKSWVTVGRSFFTQTMLIRPLGCGGLVSQPVPRTESRFARSTLQIRPIDGA